MSGINKIFIFLFLIFVHSACKNNSTSSSNIEVHDLSGTYFGVVPCSDCPSRDYELKLNEDGSFSAVIDYHVTDRQHVSESGNWKVAEDTLILDKKDRQLDRYLINGEKLILLDLNGEAVESAFDEGYILTKAVSGQTNNYPALSGNWILTEINGVKIDDQKLPKIPQLNFDLNNKKVTGNTGCNSLGGTFNIKDDMLSFNELVTTRMACPDTDIEQKFLMAIEGDSKFTIENEELHFYKNNKLVMLFKKNQP